MHILGLPDFPLSRVKDYVANRSAFLPTLGKIKLPSDLYPNHETIENNVKIYAGQLGYLRLAEKAIADEVTSTLSAKKADPDNKEIADKLTALNVQKDYILSLNERITLEALDYVYMTIIQPQAKNNAGDQKSADEISKLMHARALKWERSSIHPAGLLVRDPDSTVFGNYIDLTKEFITKKNYQSESIDLPADESIYLKDFLQDSKTHSESKNLKDSPSHSESPTSSRKL